MLNDSANLLDGGVKPDAADDDLALDDREPEDGLRERDAREVRVALVRDLVLAVEEQGDVGDLGEFLAPGRRDARDVVVVPAGCGTPSKKAIDGATDQDAYACIVNVRWKSTQRKRRRRGVSVVRVLASR